MKKGESGFTFVELMVVVSIFGMIVIVIAAILSGGRRAWLTSEAQIDVHSSVRGAMSRITEEIGGAGPGNVSITNISASEDNITFRNPISFTSGAVVWSDQIQFSLGGLNGQQIVRTNLNTGATDNFGNYITTLQFAQPATDIIEVGLVTARQSVIGDNLQMQLTSQVTLRNR
ncbi:MAG: prepilin-type N-terminal cleavage/methylation domain-containing protein [Candidatus Omnitrophota bacterium]